jgi:hypothetical protein
LIIDAHGVVLEAGVGVQHRFAWSDCDAVLRFPDRMELMFAEFSVVIRASEWFGGDQALAFADHLMPPALGIQVAGDREPDIVPFRLDGLARHTIPVLVVAALSSTAVAACAFTLSAPGRRWVGVLFGLLFLLPIQPLIAAIRRRMAVPSRWRQAAVQTSGSRVRFDSVLARASNRNLSIARALLPPAGVLAATAWWMWTGTVSVAFVLVATALAGAISFELNRRRRR